MTVEEQGHVAPSPAAGRGIFEAGERIMLRDARGRRYMIRLQAGAAFHFHGGSIQHDAVIGSPECVVVRATSGTNLLCLRPTMADFVLKMPRGAQVIYPKDIGAILVHADIAPGSRVLEAGTGSGSLSIGLARAVGPGGALVSYEAREDFHATATANLTTFFDDVPAWVDLRQGDVRDVAAGDEVFDRVVLDLPEPWAVLDEITEVLRPGGILCSFLPTTNQTREVVLAMDRARYGQVDTFEVMIRHWHVTDRSVRPDHRMVAHTGFLTTGRRPAPGSGLEALDEER